PVHASYLRHSPGTPISPMSRKRRRFSFRHERGQAFIFVVILLPVLLGLSALGIDVGGWYTQSRKAQSAADAAALAAAWHLRPTNPSAYYAEAIQAGQDSFTGNSADWNPGGGTADFTVPFDSGYTNPDETIKVTVHATSHTFFSKIFGIDGVNI